jgi:hypothetical protein
VKQKRRHERIEVDASAQVSLVGSPGDVQSARVQDVSQGGLKLVVTQPVEPGELVKVEMTHQVLVAHVRNSQKCRDGYEVGVELIHTMQKAELDSLLAEWRVEV